MATVNTASDKAQESQSPVSPLRPNESERIRVPESPTTAQPLDFSDDELTAQTPTKMSATEDVSKPEPPPKDEQPPTKPPRPMSQKEQAELTLREAFPSIDAGVIKAVLTASGGQTEPAFNALLEMTDPDAAQREAPPPRPPRPTQQQAPTQVQPSREMSQLEADELYARQLAEHYNNNGQPSAQNDRYNSSLAGSRTGRPGANPNPDDVHWRSFIDGANDFAEDVRHSANEIMTDDLPEIRDNIKKGFFETQKTVNSWITNFKKNFEEPAEDADVDYTRQNTRLNAQSSAQPQRRSGEYARRSADYNRYDADPQVIGDDFSKLDLKDGDHPPRTSSRPVANPNLFRSDRRESSKGSGRKVSFQDGPPEEIEDMYSSPKATTAATTVQTTSAAGAKSSKWQPLSAVEPSPVGENDPFSLGDSDDEKDAKPIAMKDATDSTEDTKAVTDSAAKATEPKQATVEDAK